MELHNLEKPSSKQWLGLIAWLLVVLLGFAAAYLYNRNLELASDNTAASTNALTLTSNISALKSEITKLENAAKQVEAAKPTPVVSNAERAAKAYYAAQAKGNVDLTKYSAKLMAESGVFKRYSVSPGTGGDGVSVIVKKVGDDWVAVSIGQSLPSKATGEQYSMPTGWFSTDY